MDAHTFAEQKRLHGRICSEALEHWREEKAEARMAEQEYILWAQRNQEALDDE